MKKFVFVVLVTLSISNPSVVRAGEPENLPFEVFAKIISSLREAENDPKAVAVIVASYSGRAAQVAKNFAAAFAAEAAAASARAGAAASAAGTTARLAARTAASSASAVAILAVPLVEKEYENMLPAYRREQYFAVKNECDVDIARTVLFDLWIDINSITKSTCKSAVEKFKKRPLVEMATVLPSRITVPPYARPTSSEGGESVGEY